MNKKIALASTLLMFTSIYADDVEQPSSSGVYDAEAQETDDLGTEVDQQVAELVKNLAEKVNEQSEQISDLQQRISELEKNLGNNSQNESISDAPYN